MRKRDAEHRRDRRRPRRGARAVAGAAESQHRPTQPLPSPATGATPSTDYAIAAIIATASDAMLRVSEIAALRVGDIERTDDDTATVTVRRSKTDQDAAGAVLFLACTSMGYC